MTPSASGSATELEEEEEEEEEEDCEEEEDAAPTSNLDSTGANHRKICELSS